MSKSIQGALTLALALACCITALPAPAAASDRPASILVKVEPGTDVAALAERNRMAVRRDLPEINWVELEPLGDHTSSPVAAAATARALGQTIETDPAVRAVDPAAEQERLSLDFVPRDPVLNPEITFEDGAPAGWHFYKPNFPIAWDLSLGLGVYVAVIDSEFDTGNPDLRDKLVVRYNAANGQPGYGTAKVEALETDVIHGSHVSGLIGAKTDNLIGAAGACFECGLVAIKIGTEASGTFVDAAILGDIAQGLVFAANSGARVVNMSLGTPRPHQPLLDAISYAASRGLVIVASAGNTQLSAPGTPHYPAAYPNVIGVGATTKTDTIASFSSQGSWVDLVAPGEEIISTTDFDDPDWFRLDGEVDLATKSGTSMSAPIVAGLAGLMISARPDLNPAEVEGLMKATARDLGFTGPDLVYGAGRIEAAAAVAAARAYVRPVPPPPPPPPAPAPKKKRKKVHRYGAQVVLRAKARPGKVSYLGKVVSKKKACRKNREVLLRAKRGVAALSQTKTTNLGGFRLSLPKRPKKRVQVIVKAKKLGPRGVCKGGKSKFIN